ncbi:MAG: lamin tail domain-containing protein, partial [Verrucomicrobia bacterium]|nr:lamin tail domain-containing protein [Verrucomicrobiota bacterium]
MAQYTLLDTIPPLITTISPIPGAVVPTLTSLEVTFSEPVTGVDETDLLVNGLPAKKVSGAMAGPYVFTLAAPAAGPVQISWAANHGIHDFATAQNGFAGAGWSYTVDTSGAQNSLTISEIMYNPPFTPDEDVRYEWLELHNNSVSAVNLRGWRLTKSVHYTFTNTTIPAGGYLVVAANVAAFRAIYTNQGIAVVGDWDGGLGNNGDTIELRDALNNTVSQVTYASQGDWSRRLRARGEQQVAQLTRSGNTATAFVFFHDLSNGDWIKVSGADQPEFNGVYQIANGTVSTFTYTMTNTSGSTPQATGMIIYRQLSDLGHVGWSWSSLADGLGRSLELINDSLPNSYGQNWAASTQLYGTPGAPNSVATNNVPPLILDVQHYPLVPLPTNTVTVHARLLDEHTNGLLANLYYRNLSAATPGSWFNTAMYDDGAHGDGGAADGTFAGQIPPQTNFAVIEFYVEAFDAEGNRRTWPPPALGTNDEPIQAANALYQVDNTVYAGNQPVYRLIMSAAETNELKVTHDNARTCDALMNTTFITLDGTESLCVYGAGARNRGAGTRSAWPMNYAVSFPNDTRWKGRRAIHLNSQYVHSQAAGSVLALTAGLDTEAARVVQLRINGVNLANPSSVQYGSYIELEDTDSDFSHRHWPNDGGGNLYRLSSGNVPTIHLATLDYLGTNISTYTGDRSYGTTANSGRGYFKASNVSQNDWSDIIGLMQALAMGTNTASDALYSAGVRQVVNVEQ